MSEDALDIAGAVQDPDDNDSVLERSVIRDHRGKLRDRGATQVIKEWIRRFESLPDARHRGQLTEKVLGAIPEPERRGWGAWPDLLGLLLQIGEGELAYDGAAAHSAPRTER